MRRTLILKIDRLQQGMNFGFSISDNIRKAKTARWSRGWSCTAPVASFYRTGGLHDFLQHVTFYWYLSVRHGFWRLKAGRESQHVFLLRRKELLSMSTALALDGAITLCCIHETQALSRVSSNLAQAASNWIYHHIVYYFLSASLHLSNEENSDHREWRRSGSAVRKQRNNIRAVVHSSSRWCFVGHGRSYLPERSISKLLRAFTDVPSRMFYCSEMREISWFINAVNEESVELKPLSDLLPSVCNKLFSNQVRS